MRHIWLALSTTAVLLLGMPSAFAVPTSFVAFLSGTHENPANGSPGTGFAEVELDLGAQTMHVHVTFGGLLGTTTASHIHCCETAPGLNDNVMVATTVPTFPGFPLVVHSGTYDQIFDLTLASTYNPAFVTAHGGTVAGAEAALVAGIENVETYLNIHTTQFPGGEIRGALVAPEPTSLVLLGSALLFLGLVRRRLNNEPGGH